MNTIIDAKALLINAVAAVLLMDCLIICDEGFINAILTLLNRILFAHPLNSLPIGLA